MFDVVFGLYNPFPLDPRHPLHMLYMFIATYQCPRGILGLGGKASKNKLKDTSFIFPVTNATIFSIFHMHAQKEYRKVLEIKSTSILNIFSTFTFWKPAMHLLKSLVQTAPIIKR